MTDFPTFTALSQQHFEAFRALKKLAEQLSEAEQFALYTGVSRLADAARPTDFELGDNSVLCRQTGALLAFPRPLPPVKFVMILTGYVDWLRRKYSLDGFVAPEAGDLVVDCGAYVGGFALAAAEAGCCVHAFEPAPDTFDCLAANTVSASAVTACQQGLSDRTEVLPLQLSSLSVDNSFLQPDAGATGGSVSVSVTRLDDYCCGQGLAAIDFLKLEAEGLEPEVLSGLGELRPRKIAIDISPERGGESPEEALRAVLAGWGYDLRTRGAVLFARRRS